VVVVVEFRSSAAALFKEKKLSARKAREAQYKNFFTATSLQPCSPDRAD
jgi:hypothetical protein